MLILDENDYSLILDNIYTPLSAEYFYVLDLNMLDYTLTPLLVLEETVCPSIELTIADFSFMVPANWNILVADADTLQLDVVEVSALAGNDFSALIHGPKSIGIELQTIHMTNYRARHTNVNPALNKHQMLCHPISPELWVNVAPSDIYNKYIKNLLAGDII